jgi:hypothetical protein
VSAYFLVCLKVDLAYQCKRFKLTNIERPIIVLISRPVYFIEERYNRASICAGFGMICILLIEIIFESNSFGWVYHPVIKRAFVFACLCCMRSYYYSNNGITFVTTHGVDSLSNIWSSKHTPATLFPLRSNLCYHCWCHSLNRRLAVYTHGPCE